MVLDYFDETYMSNENGVFKVKVPTTNKNKSKFQVKLVCKFLLEKA